MRVNGLIRPVVGEIKTIGSEIKEQLADTVKCGIALLVWGFVGLHLLKVSGQEEEKQTEDILKKKTQGIFHQRVHQEEKQSLEQIRAREQERTQELIAIEQRKIEREKQKEQYKTPLPQGKTTKPGSAFVGQRTRKQSLDKLVQKG